MIISKAHEARFRAKYKELGEDNCWEWEGGTEKGYGRFYFDGGHEPAHRVSYTIYKGEFPAHLHICHKCDNRPCVNPKHLFQGTNLDNVLDRKAKGRGNIPSGINNYASRFTVEQVRRIREFYSVGISNVDLAKVFKVSRTAIINITANKSYLKELAVVTQVD